MGSVAVSLSRRPTPERARFVRASIGALAVLVAALTLPAGSQWIRIQLGLGSRPADRPTMLLVAHRGVLDLYPEDTSQAIEAAASQGADGVEFDVQRSRDGTWWIMHDATLDRTTDGSGPVRAATDAYIASLRIDGGLGFQAVIHSGLLVPRLGDVLKILAASRLRVYIDLQHAIDADPGSLIEALNAANIDRRRLVVICRDARDLVAIRARAGSTIDTILRKTTEVPSWWPHNWLLEASSEVPEEMAEPFAAYVRESLYSTEEGTLLRWSYLSGAEAFLTKHLQSAREQLDSLAQASVH